MLSVKDIARNRFFLASSLTSFNKNVVFYLAVGSMDHKSPENQWTSCESQL
jgi:hypothetical protein